MAGRMFLYAAAFSVTSIYCILASKIEVTGKPVKISPCSDAVLRKCPELPSRQNCAVFHTPPGSCCKVCACQDEKREVYRAQESFVIYKGTNCRQCYCVSRNGIQKAVCHKEDCVTLECPRRLQRTKRNSCCLQCNPGWKERTFPPTMGFFKKKRHAK